MPRKPKKNATKAIDRLRIGFSGVGQKKDRFSIHKKRRQKKVSIPKKNAGPDKKTRGAVDEELTTDGE